ncbi:MAG: transposase [Flavobacterium sp.]|uniref:transposase n=1 Tax=Flavobacterium sp. TaxID=239 RepID=UPI0022C0B746|nr:transposase [Flavobacterium sp.]MCZ8198588.1 transposase [Flavobacterium sp.]
MQNKFKNKYRISSTRLQTWDYSNNGAYFITICTQNREHFFGNIQNGIMQLSEIGKLAEQYWMEIPNHFSFIELGNFVVMPNHVHGILIINKIDNPILSSTESVETRQCLVSTIKSNTTIGSSRFQNQGKNTISSIVGSYKSIVTKMSRQIHSDFGWQSRFHDHIIRNSKSFNNIQNYIFDNPLNWKSDKFY